MATISDIITGTSTTIGMAQILNSRQDVVATNLLYQALVVAAIREITESYPFDELREIGPQFILTGGQYGTSVYNYAITNWLNANEVNPTQICSFWLFLPLTSSNQQTANPIIVLDYKNPKEIEPMLWVYAPCKNWTRFGSQIYLGPSPDQNYVTQMRYQIEHPFTASPIQNQTVYVPNTWLEIIAYSACERAGIALRDSDTSDYCHNVLYGDPEYQMSGGKRGRPGIIAARVFNQERDASNNAGNMIPVLDGVM